MAKKPTFLIPKRIGNQNPTTTIEEEMPVGAPTDRLRAIMGHGADGQWVRIVSDAQLLTLGTGQTVLTPTSLCIASAWNARVERPEEDIAQMQAWLLADGQEAPCKGFLRAGKIIIEDGVTRLRAAERIPDFQLRVELEGAPTDEFEEYARSARLNENRKKHSTLDSGIRFKELLGLPSGPANQKELAERLKMSEAWVSSCLSIVEHLPLPIRSIAVGGEFTKAHDVLYELSRLFRDADVVSRFGESLETEVQRALLQINADKMSAAKATNFIVERFHSIAGRAKKSRSTAQREKVTFLGYEATLTAFPAKGQLLFAVEVGKNKHHDLRELQRKLNDFLAANSEGPASIRSANH